MQLARTQVWSEDQTGGFIESHINSAGNTNSSRAGGYPISKLIIIMVDSSLEEGTKITTYSDGNTRLISSCSQTIDIDVTI